MLDVLILIGGAGLPAFILIVYFRRLDKSRPEPLGLIWKSVLYGFISTVPAILAELALMRVGRGLPGVIGAAFTAFIVAGFVEEGIKFWFVKRFLFRRKDFDERFDGMVYAICVSLGFAFAENVMYGAGGGMVLVFRAFTAVPMHAAASGIMGYWIGMAKIEPGKDGGKAFLIKGLVSAVVIHGAYDFFLLAGSWTFPLAFIVLALAWKRLLSYSKSARSADSMRAVLRG